MPASEIKERPILISAPMVLATLAGTKTQTRRIVKLYGRDGLQHEHDPWRFCEFHGEKAVWQHREDISRVITEKCRHGVPGDRLWVKETWHLGLPVGIEMSVNGKYIPEEYKKPLYVDYRATMGSTLSQLFRWRPSISMYRWASRLTLEITDICVQRLQDISEEDCIAEGIERVNPDMWKDYGPTREPMHSPILSYASLWESINGSGSWAANPWVWSISFRKI